MCIHQENTSVSLSPCELEVHVCVYNACTSDGVSLISPCAGTPCQTGWCS